jgi:hypothetical protein
VLFTSDNGGVNKPSRPCESTDALNAGLKISGPFRGGKHDVWEGGFRVPYLVRWPGHVPAGTVCEEMLSLADTMATVAALVGAPLPPKDVAAEDSYNMLPAWLDKQYAPPIRPDMIVHSADGNFAIRRGPWKWIEGDYHPDTRPGALKLRADQFKSQLYELRTDAGECSDVATNHPETAKELENLLNRYREGGYSRELPPPAPPRETPAPLDPVAGKVLRREMFNALPGPPWTVVRGRWSAKAGVLRGSQKPPDKTGAAMRVPLGIRDGDIRYEVAVPFAASHRLRLQGSRRDHVWLVHVSPRRLAIVRQPAQGEPAGPIVMAEEKLRLGEGAWARVWVQLRGDQIAARVGDTLVRAQHAALAGKKSALALMVHGQDVALRDLVITGASD